MEPTLFTKIINGEIPSHKIYEDEFTFAFLDIHPVSEGHALVIPKTPVEFIWDLSDEDYQRLMNSVQKLGRHLRETLDAPHVGVIVEGMGVPHAHVHLVPFFHGHELRREADQAAEPDHAALAAVAEKVRLA